MKFFKNKAFPANFLLILFLIIVIIKFIDYFYNSNYAYGYNDRYYYLAAAQSFLEYGFFQNIIDYPYEPYWSTQIGTPFFFSIYLFITQDFSSTLLISSIISAILFLSALYPAYRIMRMLDLDKVYFFIYTILVSISSSYFFHSLDGLTEAYFYPLTVWWVYFVFIFYRYDKLSINWHIVFFCLTFLFLLTRVQSFLVIGATGLAIILTGHYKIIFRLLPAGISAIVVFILANIFLSNGLQTGAEAGHAANVISFGFERLINLTGTLSSFLFTVGATGYKRTLLIIFSCGFWILWTVMAYLFFRKQQEHQFIVIVLFTVFLISLLAGLLFRETILLRYVLYSLPFFVILSIYMFTKTEHQYIKYGFLIYALTVTSLNVVSFYRDYISKDTYGQELTQNLIDLHNILQTHYDIYKPEYLYTYNVISLRRYAYFSTGLSSRDIDQQHKNNSFVIAETTDDIYLDDDRYLFLGSIWPRGEYYVFYFKE